MRYELRAAGPDEVEEKTLYVWLSLDQLGRVILRVSDKNGIGEAIALLDTDGVLCLSHNVSRDYGLALDEHGCIQVEK